MSIRAVFCVFVLQAVIYKTASQRWHPVDRRFEHGRHGLAHILRDPTDCDWCTEVMDKVFNHFLEGPAQDKIVRDLEKICDEYGAFATVCYKAVEGGQAKIIALMKATFEPTWACGLIEMCPVPGIMDFIGYFNGRWSNRRVFLKLNQDVGCEKCHFVLDTMLLVMKESLSDKMVGMLTDNVCHTYTGIFHSMCVNMASEFAEKAFVVVEENLNPANLCVDIEMCPAAGAWLYK